jgi:hypothetical protein
VQEASRRPKTSPNRKIFPKQEGLIAELRKRNLGHQRIQNELSRLHNIFFQQRRFTKHCIALKSRC